MDWLDNLISTAGNVYSTKYTAQASAANAAAQLGQNGYYVEGQPGVSQTPTNGIVLSTGMALVIGGVLLVVLMMKD